MTVKFISYSGKWPNLCHGLLKLEVDGVVFTINGLTSGGSTDWRSGKVEKGEWTVYDWPDDFPNEAKYEAEEVINTHVPHGCCGGCI